MRTLSLSCGAAARQGAQPLIAGMRAWSDHNPRGVKRGITSARWNLLHEGFRSAAVPIVTCMRQAVFAQPGPRADMNRPSKLPKIIHRPAHEFKMLRTESVGFRAARFAEVAERVK